MATNQRARQQEQQRIGAVAVALIALLVGGAIILAQAHAVTAAASFRCISAGSSAAGCGGGNPTLFPIGGAMVVGGLAYARRLWNRK